MKIITEKGGLSCNEFIQCTISTTTKNCFVCTCDSSIHKHSKWTYKQSNLLD